MYNQTPDTSSITKREHQVLQMIAYEQSTKQIAHKLYVSYDTIHTHRKSLLRKCKVKNTAGLVRVAFERGYLKTQLTWLIVLFCTAMSFGQVTWLGNNSNYEDPTNWSGGFVPINESVVIPSTANDPFLSDKPEGSLNIWTNLNVTIENGASLTIGENNRIILSNNDVTKSTLSVQGTLTNFGTLVVQQNIDESAIAVLGNGVLNNHGLLSTTDGDFALWIFNEVNNFGIIDIVKTIGQSIILQGLNANFTNHECGRLTIPSPVGADDSSQSFTNNGYIDYQGFSTSFGLASFIDNGFQYDPDGHFPNDNTTELFDPFELNGVYNGNDTGGGSLRCAIQNADAGDTVSYQVAPLTTSLTSGEILLTKSVYIHGFGAEFNGVSGGSNNFRIFKTDMNDGGTIEFKGLLLSNGGGPSFSGCGPCFDTFDPVDLRVEECIFQDNNSTGADGGGIQMFDTGSSLVCMKSIFRNNSVGRDGGAIYANGELSVINCLFHNNEAGSNGGAIYMPISADGNSQEFYNNTFANNVSTNGTDGLHFVGGNVTLFNNILNHAGADLGGNSNAYGFIAHNLIGDVGSSGVTLIDQFNNINAAPFFVNPSSGNFELQNFSPGINAGGDTISITIETDLIGNPRFQGTIDMGAYEFFNQSCDNALFLECDDVVSGDIFGAEFNSTGLPSCENKGTADSEDVFSTGAYYSFIGTGDKININITADFIPSVYVYKRDDPFGSLPLCESLECVTTNDGSFFDKFIIDGDTLFTISISSEFITNFDSENQAEYIIYITEQDFTIIEFRQNGGLSNIEHTPKPYTLHITCEQTCNDWAEIKHNHYMPSLIQAPNVNFSTTDNKVLAGQSVVAAAQNSVLIKSCTTFEVELGAEFEAKIDDCIPDPCGPITSPTGTAQVPNEFLRWNAISFDSCVNEMVFAITDESPEFEVEITDNISGNFDAILTIVPADGAGGASTGVVNVAPGQNSFINFGVYTNVFGKAYNVSFFFDFDGNQLVEVFVSLLPI